MTRRQEVLQALLAAQRPLEDVAKQLASFEWDSDELVELRAEHVVAVLERFLRGDLRAEDVHMWADLVEGRDDIGLEQAHQEALKQAIFQLATPELEGPLGEAMARRLIAELNA
jgi:hypothetical protein